MKKWICISSMIVTVVLAIVGWLVLPETVIVQVGFDGTPSNTLPKIAAVAILLALALGGGSFGLRIQDTQESWKATVVSIAGMIVMAVTLVANYFVFR